MPKLNKLAAMDLIKLVRRVDVFVYPVREQKGAHEFTRQLRSPKYLEVNPNLVVDFTFVKDPAPSKVAIEFINGHKWEGTADGQHAQDFAITFFDVIKEAKREQGMVIEEGPVGGAAGGAGGKGGAKPAAAAKKK